MKKFITMKGNPIFREGEILEEHEKNPFYKCKVSGIPCDINTDEWLEKGYIKEVEEKEYTYSDMKRCGEFWAGGPITKENFDHYLHDLNQ